MIGPSNPAYHWESSTCQRKLSASVRTSSKDVINCWPQLPWTKEIMITIEWINGWCNAMPTCISIKFASALSSILKRLKVVFTYTELNVLRRLTIKTWRHWTFSVPIRMLLLIPSVPIYNWLQELLNRRTLQEWLLFSIFWGMTLLSQRRIGAFLLWWFGGTLACLDVPVNMTLRRDHRILLDTKLITYVLPILVRCIFNDISVNFSRHFQTSQDYHPYCNVWKPGSKMVESNLIDWIFPHDAEQASLSEALDEQNQIGWHNFFKCWIQ